MRTHDLFARQRVLAEIGDRGQARLQAATYSPSASLSPAAHEFAARYARAAGFGNVRPHEASASQPLARLFRHSAAADVGLAAADVLSQSLQHFDLLLPST